MVGRQKEYENLIRLSKSDSSEFVAIYGRRRVGKTYLVKETFSNKFAFLHSGIANVGKSQQISNFTKSLRQYGYTGKTPEDWFEAFYCLQQVLENKRSKKKIVFIDEMPWLDTPKSNFVPALEHFWNGWACFRNDIMLIVCGSATSWIVNKIFHNHGGLHNRVTFRIALQPFTLRECELYAKSLNLTLDRFQILETYMVFGGIPYYWRFLDKSMSMVQNIDAVFFANDAPLKNEFNDLFASLFKNDLPYISIIEALSKCKSGLQRDEIIHKTKMQSNGVFTKCMSELEQSGFIRQYNMPGRKKKGALYQLTDNFSLFYLQFVQNNKSHNEQFWQNIYGSPKYNTWAGFSFERVCLQHITQIKEGLKIGGVSAEVYSWRANATEDHDGAQIDLVIDRNDRVVNICEMKYSPQKYALAKRDKDSLTNKRETFCQETGCTKTIHLTMVTTYGIKHNAYWNYIQSQITMNELFT